MAEFKQIELPSGRLVEVPSDMPRDQIRDAVMKRFPDEFAPADEGVRGLWNTAKVAGGEVAEGAARMLNLPRDALGVVGEKVGNIVDAASGGLDTARQEYRLAANDANRKYMLNLFDSADNLRARARAKMTELETKYGKDALAAPSSGESARKWTDKNLDIRNTMRMVGVEPGTAAETTKRLGIENTGVREAVGDVSRGVGSMLAGPGGFFGRIIGGAAMGAGENVDKGSGLSQSLGLPPGTIGGFGGAFAPGAVGAVVKQGANLAAPLFNRQGVADRALFEAMGNKPLSPTALPPSPIPAPLTLGERTGNVGANRVQLALRGDPKIQASGLDFESAARGVGTRTADEMAALAGAKTEREASEYLRKSLTSAYQAEKKLVTPDVERVKASLPGISTQGYRLDNHIGNYVDKLTAERQSWLRGAGLDRLEKIAQARKVPLNEVDDVLSSMKAAARDMPPGSAPRVEVERFIGHMQKGMEKVVPGMRPAYRQYAQFKGDFEDSSLVGKLFERNKDRTFKIQPSEIGARLSNLPVEAIERAAKISPQVKDAGKQWLSAAWRENTTKVAGDTASYAAARTFFRDNEAFFKAFYSPADYKRAKDILATLEMREAPRNVTGITRFNSPTFEKIQNATFLDGLAGKALDKIPGAQKAMEFFYSKSSEQIKAKLAEALLNPDTTFARLLKMKPTPGNAALLKAYWTKSLGRAAVYQGAQGQSTREE